MSAEPAAPAQRGQVSPDQLDRLLTLIRPRVWIVLAALLVLVGLAVAWGFLGTVSETVPSSGILQRGDGLSVVQAPVAGRVTALEANLDAKVQQGDALASVTDTDGGRTVLRAPIDGRVVDAVASRGAVVAVGEQLFALEPTSGPLAASIAVPVDRRSEIYVGAPVQVRPNSVGARRPATSTARSRPSIPTPPATTSSRASSAASEWSTRWRVRRPCTWSG